MVRVASTMLELGTVAPDFALPDTHDKIVRRKDFIGKPLLVVFMCNHCPFVKHLADPLARFAREYQAKGLAIVGINSNDVANFPDDSQASMVEEVKFREYTFPYLYDEDQSVALAYRASCTPDFFLFDQNHRLVYRGQFDQTRPHLDPPQKPTGKDLRAAADAALAGQAPSPQQFPSIGCNIKWKPGNEPDYFPS